MTQTIAHRVRDWVEREPERELWTFRDLAAEPTIDRTLTYGGLWQGACAVAEALHGIERGSRALVVLPLGLRLLQVHLGVQLAGAIPIIHSHPSAKVADDVYLRHLGHVIDLMRPAAVVTNQAFSAAICAVQHPVQPRLIDEEALPGSTTFEPKAWLEVDADDIAIIQHSSGSTGLQKGIALTHAMVQGQCAAYASAIAADPQTDRICSWIPLYHDMGLFTSWLMPLLEGVPVAAIDPFAWVQAPATFLKLIADKRGTLCWQPNFAYNLLAMRVSDRDLQGLDLSSMRGISNCSEPVRADSHRVFIKRFRDYGLRDDALWVCYAMAENAFAVTRECAREPEAGVLICDTVALSHGRVEPATDDRATDVVSCGVPIPDCEVRVVDDARTVLADRRVGEIALRSPYMLRAYYQNPEATAKAIDAASWYYTGDLGFLADGHLYITGRKKDLLIVGGRNFYPQDIEAVCDQCPHAVPGRAVAIGVADEATGTERIIVLVESARAAEPKVRQELSIAVRLRVIEDLDCQVSEVHVVPHKWLIKTTSGKIARTPNLERFRAELAPKARESAPPAELAKVHWATACAWGLLAGITIYLLLALQPSLSWGVYANF